MKKRIAGIFCALFVCAGFSTPVLAESELPLVVDGAGLLTDSEERNLESKLKDIGESHDMDIVVVTAESLEGATPQDYADDYYDYNGYADDGILLLVAMEDRDWYISTKGFGIEAVTDEGLDYMSEQFLGDLSDGNYYDSFVIYADLCDDFITQAEKGDAYDVGNLPKEPFQPFMSLLISHGIGLVVAFVVTQVMKSQLKSVRFQPEASNYIKAGSMHVTQSRDLFLYKHIDRRAKPKESESGGSSTHVSSSGSTHGGGGGKF